MNKSHFWDISVPRVLSTYAVMIFVMLWVGFAAALILDPEWLDLIWNWVRALPTLVEILIWVFVTPVMAALGIRESSWTVFAQILAYSGIVGWTALAGSSFLKAWRRSKS